MQFQSKKLTKEKFKKELKHSLLTGEKK